MIYLEKMGDLGNTGPIFLFVSNQVASSRGCLKGVGILRLFIYPVQPTTLTTPCMII